MANEILAKNYLGYAIFLCFATGVLIHWLDVTNGNDPNRKTEQRVARAAAWINIGLGGAGFLARLFFF